MPNPKSGTVAQTTDLPQVIADSRKGRVEFKLDKTAIIHLPVGKTSFPEADLRENIEAVIAHMTRIKPAAAKGQYIKRACLAATRTPSVTLDVA